MAYTSIPNWLKPLEAQNATASPLAYRDPGTVTGMVNAFKSRYPMAFNQTSPTATGTQGLTSAYNYNSPFTTTNPYQTVPKFLTGASQNRSFQNNTITPFYNYQPSVPQRTTTPTQITPSIAPYIQNTTQQPTINTSELRLAPASGTLFRKPSKTSASNSYVYDPTKGAIVPIEDSSGPIEVVWDDRQHQFVPKDENTGTQRNYKVPLKLYQTAMEWPYRSGSNQWRVWNPEYNTDIGGWMKAMGYEVKDFRSPDHFHMAYEILSRNPEFKPPAGKTMDDVAEKSFWY